MLARSLAAAALAALLLPAPARADVVLEWNAILLATLAAQSPPVNPFAQARFAAITHIAIFDAVKAAMRRPTVDAGADTAWSSVSEEAAVVAAAHVVLRTYFPASAASLDASRAASLAAIPDGPAKEAGVAAGEAAAAAIIAARAADGSTPPAFHLPASSEAGEWQTTPTCPAAGGILRHWGGVVPFALQSGDQFRSPPPPPLSSRRYARDYAEVSEVGDANSTERPPDRADVARFFAAVPAVPVWNPVAQQVARARGTSLFKNARTFAALNAAISDGLVSSMETKYHYNLWRPETAIRAGDADGNGRTAGDPAFVPFIAAPCFPTYPSAHASASYAAQTVLRRFYGDDGHAILLWSPAVPGVTLHYSSFSEITADIDDARVFGGIHFRFDQEAGARQGARVGHYVWKTLR